MPPAFILSQDQTLYKVYILSSIKNINIYPGTLFLEYLACKFYFRVFCLTSLIIHWCYSLNLQGFYVKVHCSIFKILLFVPFFLLPWNFFIISCCPVFVKTFLKFFIFSCLCSHPTALISYHISKDLSTLFWKKFLFFYFNRFFQVSPWFRWIIPI